MNMLFSTIYDLIYEAKMFGFKEILYHIFMHLKFFKDKYKTLFMLEKEKKFKVMSKKELAKELEKIFRHKINNEFNIEDPVSFTEKIQWLKIYDSTPIKTKLADKYAVREWVSNKIGSEYLIPLIGVWDKFEEIDFSNLPNAFCLKTNHSTSMNYVVKDKSKINIKKVQNLFHWWMMCPFWVGSIELHYKNIPRKIIAEKYIVEMDGGLYDYKFHCFNGKPLFIQCIGDRDLKKHTGHQLNYDLDWKPLKWIFEDYPAFPYNVSKPKCLSEMIRIAKLLSADFSYVRVDLYEIGGKVYFGEMTFTPSSGFYPYKGTWTRKKDIEIGNYLDISR